MTDSGAGASDRGERESGGGERDIIRGERETGGGERDGDRGGADIDQGIEERAPGSRVRYWLLLDVNRHALAAAIALLIFCSLVVAGRVDPTPLPASIDARDPIETTFQALLTAIVTGVTLVVTINQLVLSQELGAVGDQRDRMEGARDFRSAVEGVIDEPVSPADPAAFMSALVEAVGELVVELDATAADDAVSEFADEAAGSVRSVREELTGAQFGAYEVLQATLDFDYSTTLYRVRQLRADLDGEADGVAAELVHALELFGPAREHFKTLYFQWELINLSRAMLYSSVPALVVSAGTILFVSDVGTITGSTVGVANLVWYVAAAVTISLVPFCLLLSFVLRIATITKRTLAMGPFVLRSTGEDAD